MPSLEILLQRMVLDPKLFNISKHVLKKKSSLYRLYRLHLQTTQTLGEKTIIK